MVCKYTYHIYIDITSKGNSKCIWLILRFCGIFAITIEINISYVNLIYLLISQLY